MQCDAESISIAVEGGASLITVPLGSITRFDVAVGREGHALKGLVAGAIVGAGMGLAASVCSIQCSACEFNFGSRDADLGRTRNVSTAPWGLAPLWAHPARLVGGVGPLR